MSDRQSAPQGDRLAKVIARAGLCSRREAESWISAGRVSVNGGIVKTPAFNVLETDTITVDGKPVKQRAATQLWLYHKPAGLMVTEKDPEGRPTVFEAFTQLGLPRVLTVGRLDFNTEGLLILTNDGGLKRTLELPATGWVRRYRVRAFGKVTQNQLDTLADGITVDGVEYGPIEATLDSASGANVWISMSLREGKNREVRNVLGSLGLEVNRLIRLSYGPFQLGDLPIGAVERVKSRILQDQLGKRLAEQSGADFDSPEAESADMPRRRKPDAPESRPTERDRFGGLRKRPDFKRREEPQGRERVIHFDDGRPSQTFVQKPDFKRGKRDEGGDEKSARPRREGDFKRRDDDGPRKFRKDGDKPFRKSGQRSFTPRDGDAPRKPRGDGERPFRKDGPRPARAEGKRPYGTGPRRDGAQTATSDRPARRDSGKPFARREDKPRDGRAFEGPRTPRGGGGKPGAKGFGGPRGDKPGGKPAGGPGGGKPSARPSGGPRGGKPGGRPGGARPTGGRPSGGRPSGPPRGRK